MNKQTGMIISIIGSVICLCLAASCCGAGIGWAPTWDTDLPPVLFIILGICLGLIPIIVAVLLWVFLVIRVKDEDVAAEQPMEM
jgi:drug/metabolite transporter (DMT)-like permease